MPIDVPERATCTCSYEDVGDGESGPSLSVDFDPECPTHGREAEPEKWDEPNPYPAGTVGVDGRDENDPTL